MRPAPSAEFAEAVLEVVAAIPPGTVMTYGDVAAVLGSRAARAVGNVMAWYGSDVPWWRVIRASGLPPIAHEERARTYYEAEGTPLVTISDGYKVNLRLARHIPG